MYNISISSPNMKYLSNKNNNHFFIKRKLKASICTGKWKKEDDMLYHYIMWCLRLSKKRSLRIVFSISTFQCPHDKLTTLKKHYKQKGMKLKEEIKKKKRYKQKQMKLKEGRRRSPKWLQKVETERTRRTRRRRRWNLAKTRNKPEKI